MPGDIALQANPSQTGFPGRRSWLLVPKHYPNALQEREHPNQDHGRELEEEEVNTSFTKAKTISPGPGVKHASAANAVGPVGVALDPLKVHTGLKAIQHAVHHACHVVQFLGFGAPANKGHYLMPLCGSSQNGMQRTAASIPEEGLFFPTHPPRTPLGYPHGIVECFLLGRAASSGVLESRSGLG